jgi:hypothetical protein
VVFECAHINLQYDVLASGGGLFFLLSCLSVVPVIQDEQKYQVAAKQ